MTKMRRLSYLYSIGLSKTLRPTSSNVASLCHVLNSTCAIPPCGLCGSPLYVVSWPPWLT